jgi:lysosomal alpha-mannosidase
MIKRKLNFRPTWNLELQEPISGNYYPVTTKISVQDKNTKETFSVLTDRAQGASSLNNGEIELMASKIEQSLLYWFIRIKFEVFLNYN